jgi:chemotaxis protein methyltransferase CheR
MSGEGVGLVKISDDEFRLLAAFIKDHSGINLADQKKTLLVGRLNGMLQELGIDSFMEYYRYLRNDKDGFELSRLIDRVTTNHTYFMRESEHFAYLSQTVLPYFKESLGKKDLRVWCAASSSGEEPYTLAILIHEFFKQEAGAWDKKLLATDLSLSILEEARAGIYHKDKVVSLPKVWLLNYFNKINEHQVQVKEVLKKEVVFRRFNLLEPTFPFKKKFHIIFCRNVMIYFDSKTKDELIEKMYDALDYGGYLFIGHSESVNREQSRFKYIRPAVYRKI